MFDFFVKNLNVLSWLGFKGTPGTVRKPDGYTKTSGPHGEVVDCDTLRCVHCQFTWEVVVGSGRLRGFCRDCMGYTCGAPACMVCVPWEQRLENVEAGRDILAPRPPSIIVP